MAAMVSEHHCPECELPLATGKHRVGCPNRIKTTTKRKLYCIAYEFKVSPGVWDADMVYMHGDTAEEIRLQFFRSNAPELMREIRIVGIAPVIGYFVEDKQGEVLSV
jgi:hypothetical protein